MESEQIDRDLDILVRQAEAAARRYQEAREVFDHLIEQGQSANADEFRSNAFLWDKRQELIQQITMDENRLEATSGPGNARISLEAELEDSSREALTDRIRSLEERCSVATNERDRLQRRLGELDQELRGLTDDRQIEQLLEDQAEHQTELEALAADWALLKTTAWLLERTRKQYERERQPAVLRAASEQLRAITGGAYERVVQPLEATENRGRNGETLLLTSRDGRRKGLATWNRGLREQVYLSLRLGYIETYSSANEPLPIIMDDILVNCDPAHTNRSARQILNLAKNHQVLYLTCHPETIEMFRVLDPAIACFQIDNGTILRTQ